MRNITKAGWVIRQYGARTGIYRNIHGEMCLKQVVGKGVDSTITGPRWRNWRNRLIP